MHEKHPHTSETDISRLPTTTEERSGSHGNINTRVSHRTSSPSGGGGTMAGMYPGTPGSRVSNYEKDVAVFKGKEPTSQVSSSTDSGYVHGQMGDRLSNDLKLGGKESETVNMFILFNI